MGTEETVEFYYVYSDNSDNSKRIPESGNYLFSQKETNIVSANSLTEVDQKIFYLSQNYPNPFNPSTIISYQLPINSFVNLKIYNVLGQEVTTLVNKDQLAGQYKVKFDASNLPDGRHGLASGVYVCRIQAGSFVQAKKMVFLK